MWLQDVTYQWIARAERDVLELGVRWVSAWSGGRRPRGTLIVVVLGLRRFGALFMSLEKKDACDRSSPPR